MLLHRKRFLEGVWALYSFAWHCGRPLRIFVHSDGSLDDECGRHLSRIFPGIALIDKAHADRFVAADLEARGLNLCLLWRRRSVFGRKALDFLSMSTAACYITMDSDVLTFAYPEALVDGPGEAELKDFHIYSPDNHDNAYSLPREMLELRMGRPVLRRVNAGLMKIQRGGIELADFEDCLRKTNILNDGECNLYYSEQTAYACALARNGAVALDEASYTLCGDPKKIITGHYCGGGYWATRFYREGLPYLSEKMGI